MRRPWEEMHPFFPGLLWWSTMVQNPLVPRGCSLLICGSIKKHWRGKELSLLRTIGSNGELGACGAANTLCESISSDFICGLSLEEGAYYVSNRWRINTPFDSIISRRRFQNVMFSWCNMLQSLKLDLQLWSPFLNIWGLKAVVHWSWGSRQGEDRVSHSLPDIKTTDSNLRQIFTYVLKWILS